MIKASKVLFKTCKIYYKIPNNFRESCGSAFPKGPRPIPSTSGNRSAKNADTVFLFKFLKPVHKHKTTGFALFRQTRREGAVSDQIGTRHCFAGGMNAFKQADQKEVLGRNSCLALEPKGGNYANDHWYFIARYVSGIYRLCRQRRKPDARPVRDGRFVERPWRRGRGDHLGNGEHHHL